LPRQCYTEIPQFVYLKKGTHLGWQITCRHWGGTVEEEPRELGEHAVHMGTESQECRGKLSSGGALLVRSLQHGQLTGVV